MTVSPINIHNIGNYSESTRYAIEGIKLAKKVRDKLSEANLLLYIVVNKRDMRLKNQADEHIDQAIGLYESVITETDTWKMVDDLIYSTLPKEGR